MGHFARSARLRHAVVGLSLVLFLGACETLQAPSGGPTSSAPPAAGTAGPVGSSAPAEPVVDLADTAPARIAAALAAGTIDHPTSLLYRAWALFGDPQLPAEYLGSVAAEDAELFDEIELAGERVPPATREALLPYLVRPDDPRSIHATPASGAAPPARAGAVLANAPGDEAVLCGVNGWATLSSPKGYKVWALCTDDYASDVRFVFDLMDGIWDAETKLMGKPIPDAGGTSGGGDTAIDIYLISRWQCVHRDRKCQETKYQTEDGTVGFALGVAPPADPKVGPAGARTSSGYILLDRSAPFDSRLADTAAHELFHVIQNAYNWEGKYGGGGGYYHWLTESSAQWAGWHFTHGDRDASTTLFSSFEREPHVPLNSTPSDADRRYKAWTWHLFRHLESGSDAFMPETWSAVRGKTNHQAFDVALDASYSFANHFHDFAVKNVNLPLDGDPLAPRYSSADDRLTEPVKIEVSKTLSGSPPGDFPTTWSASVPRLSATYARIELEEDVRQVRLDLSAFAGTADLDADLLVRLPSGWERREVAVGETRFCRDRPEEDVSDMILVLSNHAFLPSSEAIEGEVAVEALLAGCEGGHGTITIRREKHGSYTSARNNPVQVDMIDTATITFDFEADELSPEDFSATTSSMTWSYMLEAVETTDECDLIERADGGGTFTGEGGPHIMLGWGAPDGTLFGMTIDPTKYVVQVLPPSLEMPDQDPRGWWQGSSTLCGGVIVPGIWFPYSPLALVEGSLPDSLTTLTGTRTRTLPPLSSMDLPVTETVTWSISFGASPG